MYFTPCNPAQEMVYFPVSTQEKNMKTMNFFGRELNVYRSALHTHSTTSDGKLTPLN